MQKPKQKRSIERINKILDASNDLLSESGVESLTIAKISEFADLKRTSTYKSVSYTHLTLPTKRIV